MAWPLWNIALFITCSLATLIVMHFQIIKIADPSIKSLLLRAEFVFVIETFLSVGSYFVWKTLSPLPHILSNSHKSSQSSHRSSRPHRNSDVDLTSHDKDKSDDVEGKQRKWTLWHYALAVSLFMSHISYFTNLYFIGVEPHWFSMLCYVCLGTEFQCLTGIALLNCVLFLLKLTIKAISPHSRHETRVNISPRTKAVLLICYVLFAVMTGLYTASQPPAVKRVVIPVRGLPENLKGMHIVQLSDIHLGPTVGYSKLKMILGIVEQEKPDLLVITGDLVDGSVQALKRTAQPLGSFSAKYGKLFVSGNHEYYTGDVDNWFTFLHSLGFTVLHNSNVKLPRKVLPGEKQICFTGTDDIQADKIGYGNKHTFDIKKAVKGCDKNLPVILLAHQPVAAKKALDSGVKLDVILSGHTHAGQMFPLMFFAYFANPFFAGLYKVDGRDTHVYVSTGTQYWGIPMRIATSMEITSITFQQL